MFMRHYLPWVLIVTTVVSTVGGRTAWSYLQGVRRVLKDSVSEITSIEFELKRLDQEIVNLTPAMQQNRKVVAELDVEVESLHEDVARRKEQLANELGEMHELRSSLKNGHQQRFTFSDRTFSRHEVEADLARRLASYELQSKQLDTCERLLTARETKLKLASSQIVECNARKQELAMLADDLAARLKMTRIAQHTGDLAVGENELGHVNELMASIDKRIRTMEKVVDQEQSDSAIPVNLDVRTAAERFDERFVGMGSSSSN